jgi:hypothetical protein
MRSVSAAAQARRRKAGSAAREGRRPRVSRYWIMQPRRIQVEILKLSRSRATSAPLNGPKPVFTEPRFAVRLYWEIGLLVAGGNIVVRAMIVPGVYCVRINCVENKVVNE